MLGNTNPSIILLYTNSCIYNYICYNVHHKNPQSIYSSKPFRCSVLYNIPSTSPVSQTEPENNYSSSTSPVSQTEPENNYSSSTSPVSQTEPENNYSSSTSPVSQTEPENNYSSSTSPVSQTEPENNYSSSTSLVSQTEPANITQFPVHITCGIYTLLILDQMATVSLYSNSTNYDKTCSNLVLVVDS